MAADKPAELASHALLDGDAQARQVAIRTLAAVASGEPVMVDLAVQLSELAIAAMRDSYDE